MCDEPNIVVDAIRAAFPTITTEQWIGSGRERYAYIRYNEHVTPTTDPTLWCLSVNGCAAQLTRYILQGETDADSVYYHYDWYYELNLADPNLFDTITRVMNDWYYELAIKQTNEVTHGYQNCR